MSFFVEAAGEESQVLPQEPQVLTEVPGDDVREKCGNCNTSESDCTDPILNLNLEGLKSVWKLPDNTKGSGTCLTKYTIIQFLKHSKVEGGHTFVNPFDPSRLIKLTPEQIRKKIFHYVETGEDRKRKWEDADVDNLTSAQLPGYLNWVVEHFSPFNQGLNVIVNDTIERAVSRFLALFLSNVENERSMWAGLEKNTKNKVMYLLLEYSNLSRAVDIKKVAQVFQKETVNEYIKYQMTHVEITNFILVPLSSYATGDEAYVEILQSLLEAISPEKKGLLIPYFDTQGIPKVKNFSRRVWEANVLPPWSLATLLYGEELKYDEYSKAHQRSTTKKLQAFQKRSRDLTRLGFRVPPF